MNVAKKIRFAGRFEVHVNSKFLGDQISLSCARKIVETKVGAIYSDRFRAAIVTLCEIEH